MHVLWTGGACHPLCPRPQQTKGLHAPSMGTRADAKPSGQAPPWSPCTPSLAAKAPCSRLPAHLADKPTTRFRVQDLDSSNDHPAQHSMTGQHLGPAAHSLETPVKFLPVRPPLHNVVFVHRPGRGLLRSPLLGCRGPLGDALLLGCRLGRAPHATLRCFSILFYRPRAHGCWQVVALFLMFNLQQAPGRIALAVPSQWGLSVFLVPDSRQAAVLQLVLSMQSARIPSAVPVAQVVYLCSQLHLQPGTKRCSNGHWAAMPPRAV